MSEVCCIILQSYIQNEFSFGKEKADIQNFALHSKKIPSRFFSVLWNPVIYAITEDKTQADITSGYKLPYRQNVRQSKHLRDKIPDPFNDTWK